MLSTTATMGMPGCKCSSRIHWMNLCEKSVSSSLIHRGSTWCCGLLHSRSRTKIGCPTSNGRTDYLPTTETLGTNSSASSSQTLNIVPEVGFKACGEAGAGSSAGSGAGSGAEAGASCRGRPRRLPRLSPLGGMVPN